MSRGAKVAILILVVLAILFATGLGIGLTRNNESGAANPDNSGVWVDWVKSALVSHEKMVGRADVLSTSCFNAGQGQFTIALGSTCIAVIRASETRIRSLKLLLTQGRKVRVVLESQGKDQFTIRLGLPTEKKDDPPKLLVREEGAKLSLTCEASESITPPLVCAVLLGLQ